ncbi:MAG: BMP family ABC transporter substrate-binding protein [Ilumatobacteraceae bacterium]|nr:BMP family ABC transporter substrate-binding protein [Ilumatobacteraceae bacterium]
MSNQSRFTRSKKLSAFVVCSALAVAACGGDDDDTPAAEPTADESTAEPTEEPTAEPTEESAAEPTEESAAEPTEESAAETSDEPAGEALEFDTNGDGEVRIGIAAAGPRDDGAYYQAVVDAAEAFSAEQGWGEVIVVDNIQAADAATELANLAQQPIDIMIVGASEIAEPMPDLAEQYSDIFWYCNCGAGFPESEFYLQSQDVGAEIAYTAGYATGILLRDSGGDAVTMIGCCDLGFEIQHYLSYELGLKAVDEALQFTYVPAGDFPFDFDNIQNATAAYENAVAEGADAIYPYLGGSHEPVVQLANEGGQIVLSAGASDVCTREGDLSWDIAVRFDGGDYVREIFPQIVDGSAQEGDIIVYAPGEEPDVAGAVICDATPEQQAEMDDVYALMASGELDATFGEIAAEAFGG